jgi:hypothetical protein
MAYDEALAARVRARLSREPAYEEIRMFGGLCFKVRGAMWGGVLGDDLIVRVGAEAYPAALERAHAGEFRFTGRASPGIVRVAPAGARTAAQLERWLALGLAAPPPASLRRHRRTARRAAKP